MMFCVSCGAELGADFAFCQSCGRPQKNSKDISRELPPPSQSSTFSSARTLENNDSANAPKPMRFIESIKYSLKNYANFKGRASRSEFWFWVLLNALVPFCSVFLIVLISGKPFDSLSSQDFWEGLYGIFLLSLLIPNLARIVRRLHDTNKSGKYLFFALIPLVGNLLLITWCCTKGDVGPNRFGPGDFSKGNQSQNEVRQKPTIAPQLPHQGKGITHLKLLSVLSLEIRSWLSQLYSRCFFWAHFKRIFSMEN